MKVQICKKCSKEKAKKLKSKLSKQLKKNKQTSAKIGYSGCLGSCKSVTVKYCGEKISGLKPKDAKWVAKAISKQMP